LKAPEAFIEFERLADEFYEREAREGATGRGAIEPSGDRLRNFLRDEAGLGPLEADPSQY
jgi:hypothetical protein